MIENKTRYVIHVDGDPLDVEKEVDHNISYDTGTAHIYVDNQGSLRISGKGQVLSDIRLNGRELPRWLGSLELLPGDDLKLGEKEIVTISIPPSPDRGADANSSLAIKLGKNRTYVKGHRLICVGVNEGDTRAMLRFRGKQLEIAAAHHKDMVFVWSTKANYLFPYQWYGVSSSDEIRVSSTNGHRLDLSNYQQDVVSSLPAVEEFASESPILYVDSERIRYLVSAEMEIDAGETEKLERSKFVEHLLCLNPETRMEAGWRLRKEALINRRGYIYARRLRDDYPAMVEFSIPDHRSNPREYYERADFALSRVSHPHIIRVIDYGNVAHPGYKHGAYHVRVQERITGVGLAQVLKEAGRFDAKAVLSIMIPVIDGIRKASNSKVAFTPSQSLLESRYVYGNKPICWDRYKNCESMIAGLFSLNQIWLCALSDGRVIAKVDCHVPDNLSDLHHYLEPEERALGLIDHPEALPVADVGRVLYKLITGTTFRLREDTKYISGNLSGIDARLEELALSCIIGKPLERPRSLAQVQKLLEEVWRYMHFSS